MVLCLPAHTIMSVRGLHPGTDQTQTHHPGPDPGSLRLNRSRVKLIGRCQGPAKLLLPTQEGGQGRAEGYFQRVHQILEIGIKTSPGIIHLGGRTQLSWLGALTISVCAHPRRRLKHNIQVISHTHKIEVQIPLLTFCHIFIKGIIFDTQQVEPDGIRPAKEPS